MRTKNILLALLLLSGIISVSWAAELTTVTRKDTLRPEVSLDQNEELVGFTIDPLPQGYKIPGISDFIKSAQKRWVRLDTSGLRAGKYQLKFQVEDKNGSRQEIVKEIIVKPFPHDKLDSVFRRAVELYNQKKLTEARSFLKQRVERFKEKQFQVEIEIKAKKGNTQKVIDTLKQNDGKILSFYKNLIAAQVDLRLLNKLINLPEVLFIQQADPFTEGDEVIGEGVADTGANMLHQAGHTGAGIKVAVLDRNFGSYQEAINSSELPANLITTTFGPAFGSGNNHGTQVAMVIHDMAPGAELHLVQYDTNSNLLNALDYLINEAGVDIVCASLTKLYGGPFDGTSRYSQKIRAAVQNGIVWVNSAGNYAQNHWEGNFNNNGNNLHLWPGGSTRKQLNLSGNEVLITLAWNDWATNADGYPDGNATGQDYKLRLYHNGELYDETDNNQQSSGNTDPAEVVNLQAGEYPAGEYELEIVANGTTGQTPEFLEMFIRESGSTQTNLTAPFDDGSIPIMGDVPEAITVGAIQVQQHTLKSYSGRGPLNSLGGGAPNSGDQTRTKPDLVAPSGVQTFSGVNFSGTSAAAPHIAGAAALVKQSTGLTNPADIKAWLEAHTVDISGYPSAKNNDVGSGRVLLSEATPPPPPPPPVSPTLASITPNSGNQGSTVAITIMGTNFASGATVGLAKDGQFGMEVYNLTVVNANQITGNIYVPMTVAPGPWDVVIFNPGNQSGQLSNGFTVNPSPPIISSITPNSGIQGQTVTANLAGYRFAPGASVRLTKAGQTDINATNITITGVSQITCNFILPPAAGLGSWSVVVTNPNGLSGQLPNGFTINAAPAAPLTVTSITPNFGFRGQNVVITDLAGTGFLPGATVKLSRPDVIGIGATSVVVVSSTKITCNLPIPSNATVGYWNVAVQNPDWNVGFLNNGFQIGKLKLPPGPKKPWDLKPKPKF